MNKVYVIGHLKGDIETIRVAANIPANTEIICVSSVEEIPIKERPSCLKQSVHKLTIPDRLPDPIYYEKPFKKVKGWQRPYKFHR